MFQTLQLKKEIYGQLAMAWCQMFISKMPCDSRSAHEKNQPPPVHGCRKGEFFDPVRDVDTLQAGTDAGKHWERSLNSSGFSPNIIHLLCVFPKGRGR